MRAKYCDENKRTENKLEVFFWVFVLKYILPRVRLPIDCACRIFILSGGAGFFIIVGDRKARREYDKTLAGRGSFLHVQEYKGYCERCVCQFATLYRKCSYSKGWEITTNLGTLVLTNFVESGMHLPVEIGKTGGIVF